MIAKVYPWVWYFWIVWFCFWEFWAIGTRQQQYTLSDYVWRLEEINTQWTFLRYMIAVFCAWLFFHMAFGWFK